jgi:hypothetical protein
MPRQRICGEPMTPAERQALHRAKLRRHSHALATSPRPARPGEGVRDRPEVARPAATRTLGGSGGNAASAARGIPYLARQPARQPRRIAARRQAAGHRRSRSRGAAGPRFAVRLRPRLTQEVRYAPAVIELLSPTHTTLYPQLAVARIATARW